MAWLTGWKFRKKLVVQDTYVDSDLTDFPLYVKLTTDELMGYWGRSDGKDVRFTSDDGNTLLSYEREYHTVSTPSLNAGSSTGAYWVKIPSILASSGATIYLYYGNPACEDGEDVAGTWDDDFQAVWHLNESVSTGTDHYVDSAGPNEGTLAAAVSVVQTTGQAYNALDFADTNTDLLTCGTDSSLNILSGITMSAWVRIDSLPRSYHYIFCKRADSDPYPGYAWAVDGTGKPGWWNGTDGWQLATNNINDSAWHHIAVMDGTFYKDGIADGSYTDTAIASNSNTARIGHRGGAQNPFVGPIDEIRISNDVRSAAWLKFEYRQLYESDNEISWGASTDQGENNTQQDPPSAGWLTGWSYRKKITIESTYVDSLLNNVPVLVDIFEDTDLGSNARSDGADIRFAFNDGAIILASQVEEYSVTTGKATGRFWVKIPTIYPADGTTFYLYYGNANATTHVDDSSVWTNAGYDAVWNFGTSTDLTDSAGSNDATNYGTSSVAGSNGGYGRDFTGVTTTDEDYLDGGTGVNPLAGAFTISFDIYFDNFLGNNGNGCVPICQGYFHTDGVYLQVGTTGSFNLVCNTAGAHTSGTTSGLQPSGQWKHYDIVRNGTSLTWYIDGAFNVTRIIGAITTNARPFYIGRYVNALWFLDGKMDNVRVASTDFSAAWCKFTYRQSNETGNEFVWGDEETYSAGWLDGWWYRYKIDVSNTNVDTKIDNWGLCVEFDSNVTIGRNALTSGYDICFTSADGVYTLPHEMENYSVSSGSATGDFWVGLRHIFDTHATTIFMYFGNPTITEDISDRVKVWNSNYSGVWHLDSSLEDSTYHGRDGTNSGSIDTAGVIDRGRDFTTAHITTGNQSVTGEFSLECWVNPDTAQTGVAEYPIGKEFSVILFVDHSTASWRGQLGIYNGIWYNCGGAGTAIPSDSWTYLAGRASPANTQLALWKNTAWALSNGSVSLSPASNTNPLCFGAQNTSNSGAFNGQMDEIRWSQGLQLFNYHYKFNYYNQGSVTNELTQTLGEYTAEVVADGGFTVEEASNYALQHTFDNEALLSFGGSTILNWSSAYAALGGAILGINAPHYIDWATHYTASGGAIVGLAATGGGAWIVSYIPSGDLLINSTVPISDAVLIFSVGGTIVVGINAGTSAEVHSSVTPGGIILLDGYGTLISFSTGVVADGGLVLGGETLTAIQYTHIADEFIQGPLVVSGEIPADLGTIHLSAGGLVFSGDILLNWASAFATTGGLLIGLNAQVEIDWISHYATSGGVIVGAGAQSTSTFHTSFTPAGGLVLDGTALVQSDMVYIAGGGVILDGDSPIAIHRTHVPSGGVVLDGEALIFRYFTYIAGTGIVGLIILAYGALYTLNFNHIPAGLILIGGEAEASFTETVDAYYPVSTGGITLGGEGDVAYVGARDGTGGMTTGGAPDTDWGTSYVAGAGFSMGGESPSDAKSSYESTSTGGLTLSGDVIVFFGLSYTIDSGMVVSGNVPLDWATDFITVGALLIGVDANVQFDWSTHWVASGGLIVGVVTASDYDWGTSVVADGGLTTSGAGDYISGYEYVPSGDFTLGDSANVAWIVSYASAGGLTTGGEIDSNWATSYAIEATITVGGETDPDLEMGESASGGLSINGQSIYTLTLSYIPQDGLTTGGTSNSEYGNVHVSSGGLVLGGTSDIDWGTSYLASCDLQISGQGDTEYGTSYVADGSLVFGGTAVVAIYMSHVATDGLTISDSFDADYGVSYVGELGAVTGGQVQIDWLSSHTAIGGLLIGLDAQVRIDWISHYITSGGLIIGTVAQSPVSWSASYVPDGGFSIKGGSETDSSACYIGNGGLSLGGSFISSLHLSCIADNGVLLAGSFGTVVPKFHIATGGLRIISQIRTESPQDFTTWSESDPNSKLDVTEAVITISGLTRSMEGMVYKDLGADYFDKDFIHEFDVLIN